jgi:hypothetical protein
VTVSHETGVSRASSRVPRGSWAAGVVLILIAFAAVGCGNPPGPRGWSAAEPIDAESLTLVPHQETLFAIQKDTPQTDVVWEFPPDDREQYALSESAADELVGLLPGLNLSAADRDVLEELIRGTNVGGPTVETLEDEVSAIAAESAERDDFLARLDEVVEVEREALGNVDALYGDLGISDDGATVYVPSYGGWLFAIDVETGATRWIVELDRMVGGVLVDGEQIYVGTSEGDVYALNGGNGSLLFERGVDGDVWATPTRAYDGDGIYVSTLEGTLYRLSDTFEEMWTFEDAKGAFAQRPVVDADRVYIGGWDSTLYAIEADSGEEAWTIEADNWFWGEPAVADGTLYAPNLDGKVYAVDTQSGEAHWQQPYSTEDQIRARVVVVGDALIIGARDGFVHRVSLDEGTLVGDPLQIASVLEADLSVDDDDNVYAVPRIPKLSVIDVTGSVLSETRYDLPD